MSTENDPEIRATWTRHEGDSWEVRVEKPGRGGLTIDIEPDRTGGYKGYVREFVVQEQGKGHGTEIAKAAFALGQQHDVRHIIAEATSPATVKIMGNLLGEQVVVRDVGDEAFDVAMTAEQAVTHLAKTPPGQERSLLVRADLRGVDLTPGKKPREQGDAPPKIKQQEKDSREQARDREPGQTGIARDIDPNKGQSRDPDDNPGTGGTPAPSPEPPTPELPTGSAAANPEAGRSLEALQKSAQIAQEVEHAQKTPEGKDPSGKEQTRDPRAVEQKPGPERVVEPAAQQPQAPQQKVQEKEALGREQDGPGGSAETAKVQSREAAIAVAIEKAREAAKPAKKSGLGSRIAEKVREVVPGLAPQQGKQPVNAPGLLPSKITPEMQRESDLHKALESRGVDRAAIWEYRNKGRSLTETLAAVKAVEREERGGTPPPQGKSREVEVQSQGVARDPHMDDLAAVVKAHAATRAPRVERPTHAQELARQREEDNNRQSLKFISEQLAIDKRLEQERAQYRAQEIAQIRERTGLTLEQAGREFVRLENERRANAPGRTRRGGPELGPRGVEKGGRGD